VELVELGKLDKLVELVELGKLGNLVELVELVKLGKLVKKAVFRQNRRKGSKKS